MAIFESIPMRLTSPSILAASFILILTGCQTIQDQRLPLTSDFEANAEVVRIKKPIMQFKDKHFEQQASEFDVHAMRISQNRTQRSEQFFSNNGIKGIELQTSDRFSRFIWNQLLGLQAANKLQYKLAAEREFSFQVSNKKLEPTGSDHTISVQCQTFYFDKVSRVEREVVDKKGRTSISTDTQNERMQSYLRCELIKGNQSWELSLDMDGNQLPTIHLGRPISEDAHDYYAVDVERNSQFLVNGRWHDSPFPIMTISGVYFSKQAVQLGAMSFDSQTPKVWLRKSSDPQTKQFLFSASYALMMYDWLDKDWRDQ